jgi:hypothetical protein
MREYIALSTACLVILIENQLISHDKSKKPKTHPLENQGWGTLRVSILLDKSLASALSVFRDVKIQIRSVRSTRPNQPMLVIALRASLRIAGFLSARSFSNSCSARWDFIFPKATIA